MQIFCIEDFKVEFNRLLRKNSYISLEEEIINYFFYNSVDELKSGVRLNNNDVTPYIKKRLGGSGGYRAYFLLIINKEELYLMFVHPKSGSLGSDNITDKSKTHLYKKVLECIKTKKLYSLKLNKSNKIEFKKLKQ